MAQQIKKKFIGADQVDGSKVKLQNGQALRGTDSQGQSVELLKLGSSGEVLSKGSEIAFKSQVQAEEAARISGDQSLQSAINAEASARQSADSSLQSQINSEVSRAQAAEQALQSSVSAEQAAREAADLVLQSNIDDLDGYAQDIRGDLDQEILDRQSAVSAEEAARIAGDQALQSSLNSEISSRQSADQSLQSAIDAEESRAMGEESRIEGKVNQEVLDRQSAISSEEQARIAGDASTLTESKSYTDGKIALVMSNLDTEALDSLVEVVTAFQNADSNLNQAISGLSSSATSSLQAEVAAREAADLVLDGKIAQEILDRQSGDQSLQSEIDAEESRAMGEESRIESKFDGLVSAEQSARQLADQDLQSQIDSEESARIAGDQALDAKIDGNFAMYETEVELLRSDINANTAAISSEEAARMAADLVLQGNIDSEMSRAMGVESSLQNQITQEVSDRQSAVSAEMTRAMGEESRIETKFDGMISSEQSAREAADLVLQGNIDAEMTRAMSAEQDLSDRLDVLEADPVTKTYVDGEVSNLQSQINTEKGRVDAILLAADADKDSFAEIVSLINSVDTENDSAFGNYVLSNNAALAQEVSDRQTADQSLQSQIDAEESRAMAAEQQLSSSLSQEVSNRQAAVSAEQSARIAADDALDARIDALETAPVVRFVEDEKHSVSSTLTHVMLDFKAEKIFKVVVGRMNAMKGEDYTVSEENGKTKLTWTGSFAQGGDEAIVSGDDVFCTYSTFDAESSSGSGGGSSGGAEPLPNLLFTRDFSIANQSSIFNEFIEGSSLVDGKLITNVNPGTYWIKPISVTQTTQARVRVYFDPTSVTPTAMVNTNWRNNSFVTNPTADFVINAEQISLGYFEVNVALVGQNSEFNQTPFISMYQAVGFKISKIEIGSI